ncbi:MAG: hypothetical protein PHE55_22825 [Methylococcaceae bacterium]|nr:hypothetical protein [Methylococcaceae bacterium]
MPAPKWLRRFGLGLVLAGLGMALLIMLAVDGTPAVWQKQANSQRYLATTRNIIHHTAQTPAQTKNKLRSIALTEEDLTAVANFALMRKNLTGAASASIHEDRLDFLVTVKLPFRFTDLYLNFKLIADDAHPQAAVKQVRVGSLALPQPLVGGLGWWLTHTTRFGRYGQLTAPLIREVRIGDGLLRVSLDWDRESMGQAQELITDLASKDRLRVYYTKLGEVVGQPQLKRFVGLGALVRPLFALAKSRSEVEGGDAVEENRALILVLGVYANGRNLAPAIFSAGEAPDLARRDVLLNRRIDAAQHFTGSAVLVISGQRAFADMVGLVKEINDTHGGSGFSFIDLAADRAGALFAKIAVKSEESARQTQDILSQTAEESTFMPAIRDLPENLGMEDFSRRFGDIESPAFLELRRQIEERIAACPLYRATRVVSHRD